MDARAESRQESVPLVGCVVIGRNEGKRLRDCLESIRGQLEATVYVDSGSTDGSVGLARGLGLEVVGLEADVPFTAARARNAGCQRLVELDPSLLYVQFIDGDCVVEPGWLGAGVAALNESSELAVVFGRVRERYPDASLYHRLGEIEWSVPPGSTLSCGGVAMMRIAFFSAAQGFDEELIAGEEPELCHRLRSQGSRIESLSEDMVVHDLAMTRFRQWWRRARRAGYAVAQGAFKHRHGSSRFRVQELRRTIYWGVVHPVLILAAAVWSPWLGIVLLLGYAYPARRAFIFARRRGAGIWDGGMYACMSTVGKFAECIGVLSFWLNTVLGRGHRIIEHRTA